MCNPGPKIFFTGYAVNRDTGFSTLLSALAPLDMTCYYVLSCRDHSVGSFLMRNVELYRQLLSASSTGLIVALFAAGVPADLLGFGILG